MSDETDRDRQVAIASMLIGGGLTYEVGLVVGRSVNALAPNDRFRLAALIVGEDPSYIVEVIDAHIPSLSNANEEEMDARIWNASLLTRDELDIADLALRTCSCGQRIDGFYEYVDHLKARLRDAGLITDMGIQPNGGE